MQLVLSVYKSMLTGLTLRGSCGIGFIIVDLGTVFKDNDRGRGRNEESIFSIGVYANVVVVLHRSRQRTSNRVVFNLEFVCGFFIMVRILLFKI